MVAFVFPFNFSATKAMRTALPGHFGERWTQFYAFPRRKLFVCRLTVPTLDQTNAYQSSVCTMNDENHQRNHLPRSGWCWRWFVGTVSIHCRTHYPQPHTQINATLANWRDQMRVIKWVNFCCQPPCCVHDGKKKSFGCSLNVCISQLNSFVSLISWCVRFEHLAAVIKIGIAPQHFSARLCNGRRNGMADIQNGSQMAERLKRLHIECVRCVLVAAKRHRPPRMPEREQFANWKVTCFVLDFSLGNYCARLGSAHVNSARGT